MQITFQQGESRIVNIPIIDNGNPVTLTGVLEIICNLFVTNNGVVTEVKKYSLNPLAGYGSLVINPNNQSIDLEVISADSKMFPVGLLTACITIRFTDAAFLSTGFRDEKYNVNVGRIMAGCALNELP